ncbi:hypothetical protein [Methanosarcina barkeri]|uniref:hypothetical protein n=1 Tax=Methanosarcina barkeri TaxID=2208 RepID=UPI0018B0E5D1|nr:hypothetical protein [Methanosarcina barkeri]
MKTTENTEDTEISSKGIFLPCFLSSVLSVFSMVVVSRSNHSAVGYVFRVTEFHVALK